MTDTPPLVKPRWQGLGVRFLSAVAILAICILPFYVGGWVWAILVAAFSGRMMFEWIRMSDEEAGWLTISIALVGLGIALIYAVQGLPVWAVVAVVIFTVIAVFNVVRRSDDPSRNATWTAIGLPYIIVPSVVIVLLRGREVGFDTEGFTQLIYVILVVIAADVGAYFGGSQIGGPKLAPTLSPNKTWSGAITGALASVVVGGILALFIGLPLWMSVLITLPLVTLSIGGDLLESAFKRRLGVKDTGALLPGHGGVLDRVDSLMAAVIGGAIIFMVIGEAWPIG